MLQLIDNKNVRGDGFVVSVPDIHHVCYTEGDKVAKVEIEGGSTDGSAVNWLIYAETLRGWEPPHMADKFNRDETLLNISRSLNLLGMPHEIE